MSTEDTQTTGSIAIITEAVGIAALNGLRAYNDQTGNDWEGMAGMPTKLVTVDPDFGETDHMTPIIVTALYEGRLHQFRVDLKVTDLGPTTIAEMERQYHDRHFSGLDVHQALSRTGIPDHLATNL
jgi:hypothetical protein